jgi:hypothetical protein
MKYLVINREFPLFGKISPINLIRFSEYLTEQKNLSSEYMI